MNEEKQRCPRAHIMSGRQCILERGHDGPHDDGCEFGPEWANGSANDGGDYDEGDYEPLLRPSDETTEKE